MNRHIFWESALAALIGTVVACGVYSLIGAVFVGWGHVLPGVLGIAGSSFAIFFAIYYLEFSSWHSVGNEKKKAKPSH